MKSNSLSPGKTPDYVRNLREAALREMDGKGENDVKKAKPTFDLDHKKTPGNNETAEDFDSENWVARYPGQNCEHIGNGSGGVRK